MQIPTYTLPAGSSPRTLLAVPAVSAFPVPVPLNALWVTDGGSKKEAYATLHANIDKLQAATKIFSSRLDAGISAHPPQRGRSAPSR